MSTAESYVVVKPHDDAQPEGVSTATTDYGWDWDGLYAAWCELDVPEGWRAEITEEGITVTPPPMVPHVYIASIIDRALNAALPR